MLHIFNESKLIYLFILFCSKRENLTILNVKFFVHNFLKDVASYIDVWVKFNLVLLIV